MSWMRRALLAVIAFAVVAPAKDARPAERPTPTPADTTFDTTAPLTFTTFRYVDPTVGLEAFRLLLPKGWRAEGRIEWSANPALPAQSHFRFFNPGGPEQFEIFPTQSFFWTDNALFLGTNPPGSLRFGTRVAAPLPLEDAFSRVLLPQFRPGLHDVRVLERAPLPELGRLALGPPAPGVDARAEAGKLRIEYSSGGQRLEEEMYAAVTNFVTPMPPSMTAPPYFIDYWYIDYAFAFRARRGELETNAKLFQTMAFSLAVNPRWFAKVVNTREQLAQLAIRGIEAVGRAGQIAAQAGAELRADQQAAWEQRQAAKDRAAADFSDYVLGVERYTDPHGGNEVQLPAGYGHAWANDLGEYIVTGSPSFNPNVGTNQHWEPMPVAK